MNNRIKELRKARNLSQDELAVLVNTNSSQVSKLELGKRRLTQEWLMIFARALKVKPAEILEGSLGGLIEYEVISVPELDVRLRAGGGAFVEEEEPGAHWSFPSTYLTQELHARPQGCHIVTVEGDSMLDENGKGLTPGDKVVVDTTRTVPSPPGIFALWDGMCPVLKRIEYIDKTNSILISSDNPKHKTYERQMDEVTIIGRVIADITRI